MAWTKLHTDVLGDPKLLSAARRGAKQLVVLPWLLAFAKQADDGGRLTIGGAPADPRDIAVLLPGVSHRQVAQAFRELEQIGVLISDGDGALRFAAWERRAEQRPSDSKEAIRDRVARHRETQRNALPVTTSNALDETRGNATEKKRGEENREEKKRGEEDPHVTSGSATAPLSAFEAAWQRYPRRSGSNPKRDAQQAWHARVEEGVPESELAAGVDRYAAWCEATGKVGTELVMQGKRFFGVAKPYADAWEQPSTNGEHRIAVLAVAEDERIAADAAWLATRGAR